MYQVLRSRIPWPIADANIEVDMIVQNVAPAGDYTDFTFTVAKGDYKTTKKLLEETVIPDLGGGELRGDDNIAKVSLVGVGMRSTPVLPRRCSAFWLMKTSISVWFPPLKLKSQW